MAQKHCIPGTQLRQVAPKSTTATKEFVRYSQCTIHKASKDINTQVLEFTKMPMTRVPPVLYVNEHWTPNQQQRLEKFHWLPTCTFQSLNVFANPARIFCPGFPVMVLLYRVFSLCPIWLLPDKKPLTSNIHRYGLLAIGLHWSFRFCRWALPIPHTTMPEKLHTLRPQQPHLKDHKKLEPLVDFGWKKENTQTHIHPWQNQY